jgi:hypothetical protein
MVAVPPPHVALIPLANALVDVSTPLHESFVASYVTCAVTTFTFVPFSKICTDTILPTTTLVADGVKLSVALPAAAELSVNERTDTITSEQSETIVLKIDFLILHTPIS